MHCTNVSPGARYWAKGSAIGFFVQLIVWIALIVIIARLLMKSGLASAGTCILTTGCVMKKLKCGKESMDEAKCTALSYCEMAESATSVFTKICQCKTSTCGL